MTNGIWKEFRAFMSDNKIAAIQINNLKKTYPNGVEALKGIDLTIEQGDFFGLLGPNGAGKSTTIGILCSLVKKDQGDVRIFDLDIEKDASQAKTYLGVVPQEFNFNIFETCLQIVVNQAGYYGVPKKIATQRALALFEKLGLSDKADKASGSLSGGLKRRLMIARSLVHNPKILILDEPTAGVDISLRRKMWTFLEEQNKKGLTIILTTHYLEEAESLCKNIAIIDQGLLLVNKPKDSLLEGLHKESFILYCSEMDKVPKLNGTQVKQMDKKTLEIDLADDRTITDIVQLLSDQGIVVNRVKNKVNRLEELFIEMVKT
jgi:ABC-2 type transport system ATP-binding protein